MSDLSSSIGMPVDSSYVFQLGGRSYRVRGSGVQAIELAVEILSRAENKQSLFSLRPRIRAIRIKNCTATLSHLVESTTDRRLRVIAIWLRSQCGGHIGTQVIAKYAVVDDERTRAAVAKALQCLNEWTVRAAMSKGDPSERVRRLASPRITSAFGTRLREYTKSVSPTPVVERKRLLYLSPLLELQKPIRVKSAEFIRQVLERIRRLARGLPIFSA